MKDLNEVDTILGIKIKRHSEGFALCQSHYVEKVLQRFEHLNIKEANTPFDWSIKLGENTRRAIAQLEYTSTIGSMMYAMHCTRPDISFSVGKLSRFTSNPSVDHWKAIGRVLGYLKKTISLGLFYSEFPAVLEGYSDASWITSVSDNKSTSGWIFTLGEGCHLLGIKETNVYFSLHHGIRIYKLGGSKQGSGMAKKYVVRHRVVATTNTSHFGVLL